MHHSMSNDNSQTKVQNDFNSAIKWWERKRLWYNLVTLAGGLLVVLVRSELPNGISPYSEFYLIFFWLFGANIFYTFGWAIEAIFAYYLRTPYFGKDLRLLLFICGTIFSFIWMFILTRSL